MQKKSYSEFIDVLKKYNIRSRDAYRVLRSEKPEEFSVFPPIPKNHYPEFPGFSNLFGDKKQYYSVDELTKYIKDNNIDTCSKYSFHKASSKNPRLPSHNNLKKLYPSLKWSNNKNVGGLVFTGKKTMPKDVFDVIVSAHQISDIDDLNEFIIGYNNNPKSAYTIPFDVEKEYNLRF